MKIGDLVLLVGCLGNSGALEPVEKVLRFHVSPVLHEIRVFHTEESVQVRPERAVPCLEPPRLSGVPLAVEKDRHPGHKRERHPREHYDGYVGDNPPKSHHRVCLPHQARCSARQHRTPGVGPSETLLHAEVLPHQHRAPDGLETEDSGGNRGEHGGRGSDMRFK
ncbi:hypothetical protein DICA1_B13960 [Diutina catenulata]